MGARAGYIQGGLINGGKGGLHPGGTYKRY